MLTDLLQALTVTAEVTGYPLSEAALDVMVQDLIDYPENQVVQALRLCRRECRGRLTLRDILERMDDGRPGPEAAWAQVLLLKDDRKSAVWCEEMREAWAVALSLLDSGDEVAARMAFKETYGRLLTAARSERIPPRWMLTPGSDPDHREQVVTEAARQGLITAAYAVKLLPYHQPPTPAGQALLAAVTPPNLLPEPAPPEPAALPIPVAERLAALRAAVMGAPAWSPPPTATPHQFVLSAEQDRLLAETCQRYQPELAKAEATEEAPA